MPEGSIEQQEASSNKVDSILMPPPLRLYAPGTEEYEEALRSGLLHISVRGGLQPLSPQQRDDRQSGSGILVVSPQRSAAKAGYEINSGGSTPPKWNRLEGKEERSPVLRGSHCPQRCLPKEIRDGDDACAEEADASSAGGKENLASTGRSAKRARSCESSNQPLEVPPPTFEQTRFSDIVGHGAVKQRMEEILLPLGLPPPVVETMLSGIRSQPTSILLYGPPGCGKTQLARAIAGEAQAAFFSVAPSDVLSKFVGESEGAIRAIFKRAKEAAVQLKSKCSIVFFDEIDALGQTRENGGSGEGEGCSRRVLAELLLQFNGVLKRKPKLCSSEQVKRSLQSPTDVSAGDGVSIHDNTRVVVVAATNRPADCDPALMRRFGIRLNVGLPSYRDRKRMITGHLSGVSHSVSVEELNDLAFETDGWSGSDIESLTREAAMAPIRECLRTAAVRRRRAMNSNGPADETSPSAASCLNQDEDSQQFLLASLQSLRPVRIRDFEAAISMLSRGEMTSPGGLGRRFGAKRRGVHYDSSSDEAAL